MEHYEPIVPLNARVKSTHRAHYTLAAHFTHAAHYTLNKRNEGMESVIETPLESCVSHAHSQKCNVDDEHWEHVSYSKGKHVVICLKGNSRDMPKRPSIWEAEIMHMGKHMG